MTAVTAGILGARLGRWRFVPLALALALLIAEPIQVEAHTFLVASSPAAGQRVLTSPHLLQLEFTQPVVLGGTRVEIQRSGGRGIPTGALQRSADGTVVTVRLPTLADGTYHVTWQALSEDGHPSTGDFVFGIGAAAVLPAVTSGTASPTDWPEALATWVVIAGLALLLGTVISRRWVWSETRITGERASLYMVHVLVIAGTLQEFTLTAARVGAGTVAIGSAIATAASTQAGFLALLTLAMTAGSAIGWRLRQAQVAIPWILAGLAAQALRGHPGVSGELWQESAVVIHVVVAALWVGMLAHLVGGIWLRSATWEEISHAVRRYAALALASAALVVATGIVLALGEIRQPQQLLATMYGRILLLKAALVLVALLAAAWARGFRISRPRTPPLRGLRALTRVEIGLLIGVVGVASLLGSVAPPAPLTSLAAQPLPLTESPIPTGPSLTVAGQAGWLEVYLTASSGTMVLNVVTPTGSESAATVRLRQLVARSPGGHTMALTPRSCGPGCFREAYDWPAGTTAIDITVDATQWAGGILQFAVPWPPVPSDPALIARMVATLRAQRSVLIDERVTSGPGAKAENQLNVSGEQLLQSFPYGAGQAYALLTSGSDREVVVYLTGSQIWMHLWIDAQDRLVRDVIVAPQHLLEHTFSYP
ncbi:MAG TPA: copper resistance protein CopC [Candidatus Dormibacteraeota bacterium]|nr:copper resistance protein CopC [Candidatus Dormibacteraeota bacterium]